MNETEQHFADAFSHRKEYKGALVIIDVFETFEGVESGVESGEKVNVHTDEECPDFPMTLEGLLHDGFAYIGHVPISCYDDASHTYSFKRISRQDVEPTDDAKFNQEIVEAIDR